MVTKMDGMRSGKYRVNQKVISYFSHMCNLWVLEISGLINGVFSPIPTLFPHFLFFVSDVHCIFECVKGLQL